MKFPRRLFLEGLFESATINIIGLSLLFLAPGLFLSGCIEWVSSDSHNELALFLTAGIALLLGFSFRAMTSIADDSMDRPKAIFSVVAWSWVVCVLIGMLPYLFAGVFSWSKIDSAIFETISGFSTTGSTVLQDIESNGRGILFWRQLTQWYGGMGMIVLAVTVLPSLGVGGLQLMAAESPGHKSDRLRARTIDTAKSLWTVYFGATIVISLLLWITPAMNLYDAVAHALTTASTGGFSPYNDSIGAFDSYIVELIIIFGMFLSGMNFNLQYKFWKGRADYRVFGRSSEWKLYVKITVLFVAAVVILNSVVDSVSLGTAFRDSLFNVVALVTSTGFGNVRPEGIGDFVLWGTASQLLLLFLMTVGGTFGSTAGGMKMFRMQIGLKALAKELKLIHRPSGEYPIKVGREKIEEEVVSSILGFIALFISLVIAGTVALSFFFNEDLVTALSGSISAMSNMGPALGDAGPTSNFLEFDRGSRSIIMVLMVIGRLEIYAVLLMFLSLVDRLRVK
jgi:trk system potassium uptake protein TrkH|tara:strand:+ start:19415 stop:20944 length:1530 start_codon:yes stop_codon:yes gene_type:complete